MNESSIKPRLLLHCCCAPCAVYVLEYLSFQYECTILFYNPNIEPEEEYYKRKKEFDKIKSRDSLHYAFAIVECGYDNKVFSNSVDSLRNEQEGGARCRVCYELRLRETARRAAAEGFDIFATTLSVSPHKDAALLNEIGNRLSEELNVGYLQSDFKKQNGYKRSVELSKSYGLYRQSYCGCVSD